MITEYFNIHDIVKIQINKEQKGFYSKLNPEFEYFKVDSIEKPDIIVNVGKFKPETNNCYNVDGDYWVKEDFILRKDRDYRVQIRGLEDFSPAVIDIQPNPHGVRKFWPVLATQNLFIRPLIEILAIRRGYALLHSACLSDKKNGYLITGRGGSGKTSLIIHGINNGLYLLGEERTLVGNGKVFPYLLNIKLIEFWTNNMKDEYSRPKLYKYKAFKAVISEKPSHFSLKSPVKLKSLYLIKRRSNLSKCNLITLKKEQIIDPLVFNNLLDWEYGYMPFLTGIENSFLNRFFNSYLYINFRSKLNQHWENLKSILSKELNNLDIYEYQMPIAYNESYAIGLLGHIKNSIKFEK